VAINAIVVDLRTKFLEFTAVFNFVAGQAMGRERRSISLELVNVMARRTGHGAATETAASRQQLSLVTVNIDWSICLVRNANVILQHPSRDERQRRSEGVPLPGMAGSTDIDLSVAGKRCRIHDRIMRLRNCGSL
jgi:hypothetical protein